MNKYKIGQFLKRDSGLVVQIIDIKGNIVFWKDARNYCEYNGKKFHWHGVFDSNKESDVNMFETI